MQATEVTLRERLTALTAARDRLEDEVEALAQNAADKMRLLEEFEARFKSQHRCLSVFCFSLGGLVYLWTCRLAGEPWCIECWDSRIARLLTCAWMY
jgi:hypothetical protein